HPSIYLVQSFALNSLNVMLYVTNLLQRSFQPLLAIHVYIDPITTLNQYNSRKWVILNDLNELEITYVLLCVVNRTQLNPQPIAYFHSFHYSFYLHYDELVTHQIPCNKRVKQVNVRLSYHCVIVD